MAKSIGISVVIKISSFITCGKWSHSYCMKTHWFALLQHDYTNHEILWNMAALQNRPCVCITTATVFAKQVDVVAMTKGRYNKNILLSRTIFIYALSIALHGWMTTEWDEMRLDRIRWECDEMTCDKSREMSCDEMRLIEDDTWRDGRKYMICGMRVYHVYTTQGKTRKVSIKTKRGIFY